MEVMQPNPQTPAWARAHACGGPHRLAVGGLVGGKPGQWGGVSKVAPPVPGPLAAPAWQTAQSSGSRPLRPSLSSLHLRGWASAPLLSAGARGAHMAPGLLARGSARCTCPALPLPARQAPEEPS